MPSPTLTQAHEGKTPRARGRCGFLRTLLVPVKVLLAVDLPISARLLFFVILLRARETGKCCDYTLTEMARVVGVSRPTVIRDLRMLLSAGLIEVKGPRQYVPLDPDAAADLADIELAKAIIAHATSRGQGLLQAVVKGLYKDDSLIINARPDFMTKRSTGAQLEFDLYSPQYKVAFEFNGAQHYGPTEWFPDEQMAKDTQDNDTMKQGFATQHGIKLIVVRPEDLSVEGIMALVGDALPLREDALGSVLMAFLEKECYLYKRKAIGAGAKGMPRGRSGSIRRFLAPSGSEGVTGSPRSDGDDEPPQ